MTDSARPGAILKALRAKRGWTLSDVSQRTGFPVSTLSKIENDKVSLSYDKLARISTGLDVDIGLFFSEAEAKQAPSEVGGGRRSINRKGDGQTIQTGSYFSRFLATDLLNKRFVPMIGEGLASSIEEFGELIRHEGEEFCYVLEGVLELHSDLYAPVRLESGDAIYFDSGMGHAYISVGDTPCRALCICSGDESKSGSVTDDTFSDLAHLGRSNGRMPMAEKAVSKTAKSLPAQRVAKRRATTLAE
jgi:transcriptional regulator with XRE-family HTH domain